MQTVLGFIIGAVVFGAAVFTAMAAWAGWGRALDAECWEDAE